MIGGGCGRNGGVGLIPGVLNAHGHGIVCRGFVKYCLFASKNADLCFVFFILPFFLIIFAV